MKIIEYGKVKPMVQICKRCGCKFEYTYKDKEQMKNRLIVRCPVCGYGNILVWINVGG